MPNTFGILAYFRGEFAAASLKLDFAAYLAQSDNRFPRRIRRGLIEAVNESPLFGRKRQYFRGEFAAASLKHNIRFLLGLLLVLFPRRIRRGLIEA